MKKITILLAMMFMMNIAFSQKMSFQSAVSSLGKGFLDKAKNFIDPCITDPTTKDWPKTWYYRGNIYLEIALSKEDKYKNLDSNAANVAYDSYQKAIELDTKKEYYTDILLQLIKCGAIFYDKGAEMFNAGKYLTAMGMFEKTISINTSIGGVDTSATYNAALSAVNGKDYVKAKEFYAKLVKLEYHQPLVYSTLADLYKIDKDSVKALAAIKSGRKLYPDNYILIIAEANVYLFSGKTKEAENMLELAIQKDPTNEVLYNAIAADCYDVLVNDTSKTEAVRDTFFLKAEKAYLKAIDLKPTFFDAIYNLGALYFNDGVRYFQDADKDPTNIEKYNKLKPLFDKRFTSALPYLEKAYEINPNDYNTLLSLKQLYAYTNQTDKYKIINEKLKNF